MGGDVRWYVHCYGALGWEAMTWQWWRPRWHAAAVVVVAVVVTVVLVVLVVLLVSITSSTPLRMYPHPRPPERPHAAALRGSPHSVAVGAAGLRAVVGGEVGAGAAAAAAVAWLRPPCRLPRPKASASPPPVAPPPTAVVRGGDECG